MRGSIGLPSCAWAAEIFPDITAMRLPLRGASGSAPGCTDGSDYECDCSDQRKHDREECLEVSHHGSDRAGSS